MLDKTSYFDAIVTLVCSYLSLLGSLLVLLSYMIVQSKHTPKPAYLILHLALSDFVWFLLSSIQASFWIYSRSESVPHDLCYVASPIVAFTRMASLIWTCVISFNVLMSVKKRKWSWAKNATWESYRKFYFILIFFFASPSALLMIVHGVRSKGFGCQPGYEPIGYWYEVAFTELLPISVAFIGNIYVFLTVRTTMSKSAYPQSVRKKRKRIMYNYVLICITCWFPTIVDYMAEIAGYNSANLEIFARASLYISGFLNFLVFGMQDPHLKRSFVIILRSVGLSCLLPYSFNELKQSAVEKTVMFQEETICANADLSKDRKSMYRHHKLSAEDKRELYVDRPDLNPKLPLSAGASPERTKATSRIIIPTTEFTAQPLLTANSSRPDSNSNNLETAGDSTFPQQPTKVVNHSSESIDFVKDQAHLKLLNFQESCNEPLLNSAQESSYDSSSSDEDDQEDLDLNSPV